MNFENIFLSKKELKRLRKLAGANRLLLQVPEDTKLINLHLIEHALLRDSNGNALGWHCRIKDTGENYLKYHDRRNAERRSDRLHDWLIAIVSILGGAFLSEPLWNLLRQVFGHP